MGRAGQWDVDDGLPPARDADDPGTAAQPPVPEFPGLTFHEVRARAQPGAGRSSMPFSWTVNPYRGCSHAAPTACPATRRSCWPAAGPSRSPNWRAGTGLRHRRRAATAATRRPRCSRTGHEKPAYRITLADGTELVASGDHRFLSERGWKHVTGDTTGHARRPHLTTGNKLMGTGRFATPPTDDVDYRRGYLCGLLRGGAGAAYRRPRAALRGWPTRTRKCSSGPSST